MIFNNDQSQRLNTDTEQPPPMNFLRRFIYDRWNDQLKEVERHTTSVLMSPLMMERERIPRMLSNVAKVNPQGYPEQSFKRTLPEIDVTAAILAQSQMQPVNGAAPANNFPYKLRAVGRVNGMDIFNRAGQPGELVSLTGQIVP